VNTLINNGVSFDVDRIIDYIDTTINEKTLLTYSHEMNHTTESKVDINVFAKGLAKLVSSLGNRILKSPLKTDVMKYMKLVKAQSDILHKIVFINNKNYTFLEYYS